MGGATQFSSPPNSPGKGGGVNYNLLTLDELVTLCKKRGIRLGKKTHETKFDIIRMLKEDDRNPRKGGLIATLCRRLLNICTSS